MIVRQFITLLFLLLCTFKNNKTSNGNAKKKKVLLLLFTYFLSQLSYHRFGAVPVPGGVIRVGTGV